MELDPNTGCMVSVSVDQMAGGDNSTIVDGQQTTTNNGDNTELKSISISLPRLEISKEDQDLLQNDLTKFITTKPELATKLGLVQDKEGSLFSQMKADEGRFTLKRRQPMNNLAENPDEYRKFLDLFCQGDRNL